MAGQASHGISAGAAAAAAATAVDPETAQQAANDAQSEAADAIKEAIIVVACRLPDATSVLRQAFVLLTDPGSKSHDAATALRLVSALRERLEATTCTLQVLRAVKAVERALRDVTVLRCRCFAPPGDRAAFLAIVGEAFGGTLDSKEESAICLSYKRRMSLAPDAFPSKNSSRSRPRRPRRRNSPVRQGAAAAAAVAAVTAPAPGLAVCPPSAATPQTNDKDYRLWGASGSSSSGMGLCPYTLFDVPGPSVSSWYQ